MSEKTRVQKHAHSAEVCDRFENCPQLTACLEDVRTIPMEDLDRQGVLDRLSEAEDMMREASNITLSCIKWLRNELAKEKSGEIPH